MYEHLLFQYDEIFDIFNELLNRSSNFLNVKGYRIFSKFNR